MLTQILDHAAQARSRVLAQYREKTTSLVTLLEELGASVQEVEDAFFDLVDQLAISNATGVWLDRLGAIVGEARAGEASDILYRRYVRARVKANRSNGTLEDVLGVLVEAQGFLMPTLTLLEIGRASFQVDFGNDISFTVFERLRRLVSASRSAGIGCTMFWMDEAFTKTFTLADAAVLQSDALRGFGNATVPSTGGSFAGAYRA